MICRRRVVRSKFRHQHYSVTVFFVLFFVFSLFFVKQKCFLCTLKRGVHLVALIHLFVFYLLMQLKCRKATIIPGTKAATTATPHTPATARHGAARATHTTSRTSANVSYHMWQLCCWPHYLAGALFSLSLSLSPSAQLLNLYPWCFASQWLMSFCCTKLLCFVLFFHEDNVSFQLWWVGAFLPPPQPHRASAARAATRCPAPQFLSLPSALVAPLARGGTGRRITRAHVWHIIVIILFLTLSWCVSSVRSLKKAHLKVLIAKSRGPVNKNV